MRWDGSVLIHWLWQQLWERNHQSKSDFGGRNHGNWSQVDTVTLYTGLKSIHWQRRNILTTLGCKGLSQRCWWYVHFGVYPGTVTVQANFKKIASFTLFCPIIAEHSPKVLILQTAMLMNIKQRTIKPKGTLQFHFLKSQQKWLIIRWCTNPLKKKEIKINSTRMICGKLVL